MSIDPTQIIQPSIYIGGLEIAEPTTTITDLMIAAASFYAWWRLKPREADGLQYKFFRIFFLLTAFGTMCGGLIGHGFLYWFGTKWKLVGFYLGMWAVAAIERSAIIHANRFITNERLGKVFLVINALELIVMMVYTALTLHFEWVEYHLAYGFLIVVFWFHFYVYVKTKDYGSYLILWNTVLLLITVFIFNYPVIPHEWFNHRDLAHIFMVFAMILLMYGALHMGYRKDGTKIISPKEQANAPTQKKSLHLQRRATGKT